MARLTKLSRSLAGRNVLVTGAASGMGRATAFLFADEGARVGVVDRNAEGLEETAAAIRGAGGEVCAQAVDVSHTGAIAPAVATVAEQFGGLDVLVNNAGVSLAAPIGADDFESTWRATFAVNLDAYVHFIRAALPHLRASDAGRIVNVASTEGLGGSAFISPYTASKHGVVGLTRSLAVELGGEGITVNCICPGPIHTGMTQEIPDEAKTKFARRRVPLRRYGDPEEVAQLTVSLALPAASYVTGAALAVDGGMRVKNN